MDREKAIFSPRQKQQLYNPLEELFLRGRVEPPWARLRKGRAENPAPSPPPSQLLMSFSPPLPLPQLLVPWGIAAKLQRLRRGREAG